MSGTGTMPCHPLSSSPAGTSRASAMASNSATFIVRAPDSFRLSIASPQPSRAARRR